MNTLGEPINLETELPTVESPQAAASAALPQQFQIVTGAISDINSQQGPSLSFQAAAPANGVAVGLSIGSNVFTFSVTGVGESARLKCNFSAVIAPTINDDSSLNYSAGSQWIDTAGRAAFVCLDASVGAALWKQTTP